MSSNLVQVASNLFRKLKILPKRTILEFSERLNTRLTVFFLAVAIVLTIPNRYIYSKISCIGYNTPYTGTYFLDFFEDFCYVNGTILILPHERLPNNKTEWDNISRTRKINYYQWFFVLIFLQIAGFTFPDVMWNYLSKLTTKMNLENFISTVDRARTQRGSVKYMECMKSAAQEIDQKIIDHHRSSLWNRLPMFHNNRLTLIYIFVKLLYIVNIVGQLVFMYKFIFNNRLFPPLIFLNRPGEVDTIFPISVFCYMPNIVGERENNAYFGQCILTLNMYNKFVFTIIHYWFMFVAIITVVSFPNFIFRTLPFRARWDLIKHLLKVSKSYTNDNKTIATKFMTNYLGCDGVFIIGKLNTGINHWIASDVLTILFNDYKNENE